MGGGRRPSPQCSAPPRNEKSPCPESLRPNNKIAILPNGKLREFGRWVLIGINNDLCFEDDVVGFDNWRRKCLYFADFVSCADGENGPPADAPPQEKQGKSGASVKNPFFCTAACSRKIKSPISAKGNEFLKTKDAKPQTIANSKASLFGKVKGVFALISILPPLLFGQTMNPWPKPTVAIYDCDCSAAHADDPAGQNIVNSCSRFILRDILSDTSSQQVSLFSYGYADTAANDSTQSGYSFPLPDTGRVVDADYVIAGTLVRNVAEYTLTISLLDGHTFIHAIDAIATFSTVTVSGVQAACVTAVQKILPLATKIQNYQELFKNQNPLLSINPQIVLSPAQLNLSQKGSTDVSISVIDCDGTPMTGRQLTLEATNGQFGVSTVQTDNAGTATAAFTAGASNGMAILTATLQNAVSVTHDTISPDGSEAIIIGPVDSTLWEMDFTFSQTGTAYVDTFSQQPAGTAWNQTTAFFAQSAHGKFFGPGKIEKQTDIEWYATSAKMSGTSFSHSFAKYSAPTDSSACPNKYWSMSGSSWNYLAKADSTQEEAGVSDDPKNKFESFNIQIPYKMIAGFSYNWYLKGVWDNGDCKTNSYFDGGQAKTKIDKNGWITLFGVPGEVPGLSITPTYSGTTITGCTILVSTTSTAFSASAIPLANNIVADNECVATLKPFLTKASSVKKSPDRPKRYALGWKYSDLSSHSLQISFSIPNRSFVSLKVFDVSGKVAATIVSEEMSAGNYSRRWITSNIPHGIYLCRLQAGSFAKTERIVF